MLLESFAVSVMVMKTGSYIGSMRYTDKLNNRHFFFFLSIAEMRPNLVFLNYM